MEKMHELGREALVKRKTYLKTKKIQELEQTKKAVYECVVISMNIECWREK